MRPAEHRQTSQTTGVGGGTTSPQPKATMVLPTDTLHQCQPDTAADNIGGGAGVSRHVGPAPQRWTIMSREDDVYPVLKLSWNDVPLLF